MRRVQSTSNLAALLDEVARVPVYRIPDGSGHLSPGAENGWIQKFSNERIYGPGYPDRLDLYPHIRDAVIELATLEQHGRLTQVMVNVIHPGGRLGKHRDGLPNAYRYHLPVVTHESVTWWDEMDGCCHMETGFWHGPVNFCGVLHSVENPSDVTRIHIVADFERE